MPADWSGVKHWGPVGRTVFLVRWGQSTPANEGVVLEVEVLQGRGFNAHLRDQIDPALSLPGQRLIYTADHAQRIADRGHHVDSAVVVRGDPMFLKDSVGHARGTLIRPSSVCELRSDDLARLGDGVLSDHEDFVAATVATYGRTGRLPMLPGPDGNGARRHLRLVPDPPAADRSVEQLVL